MTTKELGINILLTCTFISSRRYLKSLVCHISQLGHWRVGWFWSINISIWAVSSHRAVQLVNRVLKSKLWRPFQNCYISHQRGRFFVVISGRPHLNISMKTWKVWWRLCQFGNMREDRKWQIDMSTSLFSWTQCNKNVAVFSHSPNAIKMYVAVFLLHPMH